MVENNFRSILNDVYSPLNSIINTNYLQSVLNSHGENLKENWFGQLMTYPQTLAYLIQINMWLEEYNVEIDV